jgi:uncharacterized lipoprotein YajG
MLKVQLLPVVALSILAGCAAQPVKDHTTDSANNSGQDVQCHSEQQTGSMFSKTVCTTKAERDAQQAANDQLRNAVATQAGSCHSSSQQCSLGQ